YAHNHGVYTNLGKPDFDHAFTIQDYLDDAGYKTAMTGKFFNDWPLRERPPHFDRWAMFDGGYYQRRFNVDGEMTNVPGYSTSFIARKSIDFLQAFDDADDAAPWFLYVAPYAPHAPFTPESDHQTTRVPRWDGNPAVFEKNRSDKPPYVLIRNETFQTWKRNRVLQLRSLKSVDALVGGVRRALRDLDENRRTLVFFMSDNGYMWADHGLYDKGAPYTPSIRIPMLMRYPRAQELPPVDDRIVANVDVAPTVLDAAGIAVDPLHPMDGKSLLAPAWERNRILTEYRNNDNIWTPPTWASTRTKTIQYVEYYADGEPVFRELYRLRSDPWQLRNVLADGREGNDPSGARLAQLSSRLVADRECEGATCP
ncbi:MAG: sulfatase-like hydrolase/transferase, partial [Actinomycetota bacterium]|nr:sulfatase-like hydrolase/transferase [Actinomycetota bacterium]